MKDILVIREEGHVDRTIFSFVKNRYEPTVIDYDPKQVDEVRNSMKISMIFAFVDEISSHCAVELRRLLMYTKDVYFCLIASPAELEKFEDLLQREKSCYIQLPATMNEFRGHFEYFLENHAGKTPEELSFDKEASMHKRNILLVDDDPVCLRNMMNWLKNFYQVAVVKSGAACISYLAKNKPDLILLDYKMPVCDGIQTLEMIRSEKEYAEIPVIFLTGVSDTEKVKDALKHKPQGYILKSSDRIDFLNKVNAVFGY